MRSKTNWEKIRIKPYKFNIGDRVVIGKTVNPNKVMLYMEGTIKTIENQYTSSSNVHYYFIRGYWFEEDCLTLFEMPVKIDNITDNEVNDILQG